MVPIQRAKTTQSEGIDYWPKISIYIDIIVSHRTPTCTLPTRSEYVMVAVLKECTILHRTHQESQFGVEWWRYSDVIEFL